MKNRPDWFPRSDHQQPRLEGTRESDSIMEIITVITGLCRKPSSYHSLLSIIVRWKCKWRDIESLPSFFFLFLLYLFLYVSTCVIRRKIVYLRNYRNRDLWFRRWEFPGDPNDLIDSIGSDDKKILSCYTCRSLIAISVDSRGSILMSPSRYEYSDRRYAICPVHRVYGWSTSGIPISFQLLCQWLTYLCCLWSTRIIVIAKFPEERAAGTGIRKIQGTL